jgi:hypothetical protein
MRATVSGSASSARSWRFHSATSALGVPGLAKMPYHSSSSSAGWPSSNAGRQVGRDAYPLAAGGRQDPDAAAAVMRQQGRHAGETRRDAAIGEVVHQRSGAAIGDGLHRHADLAAEQHAEQPQEGIGRSDAEPPPAGLIDLQPLGILGEGRDADPRRHADRHLEGADEADRHDVLHRIERIEVDRELGGERGRGMKPSSVPSVGPRFRASPTAAPVPPGRLSTDTCRPIRRSSPGASARASRSVPPPCEESHQQADAPVGQSGLAEGGGRQDRGCGQGKQAAPAQHQITGSMPTDSMRAFHAF